MKKIITILTVVILGMAALFLVAKEYPPQAEMNIGTVIIQETETIPTDPADGLIIRHKGHLIMHDDGKWYSITLDLVYFE